MNAPHNTIDWQAVKERLAHNESLLNRTAEPDRNTFEAVLRKRAASLARRGQDKVLQAATKPILVVRLGNERFGIELRQIEQVFPQVPMTRVPGDMDYLLGVANLQGVVRSVVDLRRLMHVPVDETNGGYVVLVRSRESCLAVWVEQLEAVERADMEQLAPVDDATAADARSLILGLTKDRTAVLDVETLFDHVAAHRTAPSAARSRLNHLSTNRSQ